MFALAFNPSRRSAVGSVAFCVTALLLTGCDATPTPVATTLLGQTMGTTYSVKVATFPAAVSADGLQGEVEQVLERVNAQMSTYQPDSEISRFNGSESTDWFPVSPATALVVAESLRVSRESDGAFDVTVMPLVNLWSFGPEARPRSAPTDAELQERREYVGYNKLQVQNNPPALRKSDPRLQVDLSAIAKGYGVDAVAKLLRDRGIAGFYVEIGGEIRVAGTKSDGSAWRTGIEKPVVGKRALETVVELADASMATSGDYRNYFEADGVRYSHTLDPRSGRPIAHTLAAVSVVAETCMTADAYATTVMVLGPQAGYDWLVGHDVAALLIVRQGDAFLEQPTPQWTAAGLEVR